MHVIPAGPTSITAFLGRALRGPLNVPTDIYSLAEYERVFGGLWSESALSFAIRDFFTNGGSHAVVVRLHNQASAAKIRLPTSRHRQFLKLEAASAGAWGNNLRVTVSKSDNDPAAFNLLAQEINPTTQQIERTEQWNDLSLSPEADRYVGFILARESSLIILGKGKLPPVPPLPGVIKAIAASDKDGRALTAGRVISGLALLDACDPLNLLCIPPYRIDGNLDKSVIIAAAAYCEQRKAFFILDSPTAWTTAELAKSRLSKDLGINSPNAAVYFPRLLLQNPLDGRVQAFASCGAIAGVFARTDSNQGVWKAPAGIDAFLTGVSGLAIAVDETQNSVLNQLGVNCLRTFPQRGPVIWGSRTLQGSDQFTTDWKYVPVRRTALYIQQCLERGLSWVALELNNEALWAEIRLSIQSFMYELFKRKAFQGRSPDNAYYVRCDATTTTASDIQQGVVKISVGFAPLKSDEFIAIPVQTAAAQV